MFIKTGGRVAAGFYGIIMLMVVSAAATTNATAADFGDPAFKKVWARTDQLVANHTLQRSFVWGPSANTAALRESYQQAPGGARTVQYYDKSRMEITNPSGDKTSSYYVTNGLLVKELITGQMQTGDARFEAKQPANIPIAGDPDDQFGPRYSTLAGLLTRTSQNNGGAVNIRITRIGVTTPPDTINDTHGATYVYYVPETGHNIASPFWDYLGQTAPVLDDAGRQITAPLFNPRFYATGFPVTEAYWGQFKIGNSVRDVLIQAFERRVLTYEPGAPPAYQVQMGNVGQHYYTWRYSSDSPAQPVGASVNVKVSVPVSMRSAPFDTERSLNVPPKFGISVYARVPDARFMTVTPDGDLLVSQPDYGKVTRIHRNPTGDPSLNDFVTGLKSPHDIVFHTIDGTTYLYISESNQINRFIYSTGDTTARNRQIVASGLPEGGHSLKNIALDSNHKLYVSLGSSCNACESDTTGDSKRGAIYQYNADGTGRRLFAQGIRNGEGLAFVPGTNDLWAAINNRDQIAYPFNDSTGNYGKTIPSYVDNHPPEEFTRVRDGGNYGWPFCNPNPDTVAGYDTMPFDRDVQFKRRRPRELRQHG